MTGTDQDTGYEREAPSPRESPGSWSSPDHSFTLQAVLEMHKSIGELTQSVVTLTQTTKEHGTKIDKISHRLYAAGAVLVVVLGIGSFVLDKIWDTLVAALKAAGQG